MGSKTVWRIGILGGTFDPIHKGHLALAEAALKQLQLDKMIFVPAYRHPLEQKERTVASARDRLEMVRLAVSEMGKTFEVSDCEIERKGISYTIDTLRGFRKQYPSMHELFFITGGDWGKGLDQWKEIAAIFSLCHFVIAKRPGFDTSRLPKQVEFLDFTPLDVSSTEIRKRLKRGDSVSELVPERVLNYIQTKKLY
jgi:nicotinate-nucleotide adenylyltransferase